MSGFYRLLISPNIDEMRQYTLLLPADAFTPEQLDELVRWAERNLANEQLIHDKANSLPIHELLMRAAGTPSYLRDAPVWHVNMFDPYSIRVAMDQLFDARGKADAAWGELKDTCHVYLNKAWIKAAL